MRESEHFVQLYESDDFLVGSVSGFIGAGLEAGESCIVIATRTHLEDIETHLGARNLDLEDLRGRQRFVSLDAAETLSKFMLDGSPEPQRFRESVGRLIAGASERGTRVRVFGEMVALLWSDGNQAAAIRLEELLNDLANTHTFSLFCAYPAAAMAGEALAAPFAKICNCHTRVIPAESYADMDSADDRLREITRLQQMARSLEVEIAYRKEIERDLSRRESELSDFMENAFEGLHKSGPDGAILWANNAEMELLGYRPDEYIGHHVSESHIDRDVIEDILAKLRRGESLFNYAARLRCKDGSIKHVLLHSNPHFENGELLYTHCFTRDISHLHESNLIQQRLAAIVECSDDAIIGKTLEGIITSWNNGAERIFGYTADEAIGRPKTFILPPDRLQEEVEILSRLRRGERIEHFESVRVRKDGKQVDISLTISPIKDNADIIVGASTIARDITESKQQRRELAALNARLTRSVTETHHRVKNNLQLMSALIEMQKQPHRESIPMAELVRLGQNIQALGFIHDILTHESKENGDAATISVRGVLEQLIPILQETLRGRRLLPFLEDALLSGKQTTSLALIANELISNAVKHGDGDIGLTLRKDGNIITLEVCDEGSGFPEGFDPEVAAHTGLELIESIARYDLQASTSYQNRDEGGARVGIKFSIERKSHICAAR